MMLLNHSLFFAKNPYFHTKSIYAAFYLRLSADKLIKTKQVDHGIIFINIKCNNFPKTQFKVVFK